MEIFKREPKILAMLPSKGRPNQCLAATQSWQESHSGLSDLVVAIPVEWWSQYPKVDGVIYEVDHFNEGIVKVCNSIFYRYPHYSYYMFVGDDLRFRTKGWDRIFIDALRQMGNTGVVYGDDLLKGASLCTHWCVSGDIVSCLGFFCLPVCRHLSQDCFWMEIGNAIGKLRYTPEVVTEHLHYTSQKSPFDWVYSLTNNPRAFADDKANFNNYQKVFFPRDVERIRRLLDIGPPSPFC